jgi:hypothetical protein
MKHVPATSRPRHPARSRPMWMASSVEFGPGMRLVAPLRSKNSWSPIHPRRVTTSWRIIATCAAGPPNATKPSFVKSRKSSRNSPFSAAVRCDPSGFSPDSSHHLSYCRCPRRATILLLRVQYRDTMTATDRYRKAGSCGRRSRAAEDRPKKAWLGRDCRNPPRVRRDQYRNKIAAADKNKDPGGVPSGVPDARRLYERRVA